MTVGFKQYWDTLIHLNRLHVEINQFLRKKRLWHTHIMQMRHSFTRNSGTDLIRNELNTDSQSSSWAQSRSINNSVGTLSLRLNVWFMYDKPHKKFSKDRENGFFLLFSQCSLTLSVFYDMLCICLVVSSFFLHPIRPTKYCIMRLTRTHVSLLRFGNIYTMYLQLFQIECAPMTTLAFRRNLVWFTDVKWLRLVPDFHVSLQFKMWPRRTVVVTSSRQWRFTSASYLINTSIESALKQFLVDFVFDRCPGLFTIIFVVWCFWILNKCHLLRFFGRRFLCRGSALPTGLCSCSARALCIWIQLHYFVNK